MKYSKNLLALVVALAMVISLAACGGNSSPTDTTAAAADGSQQKTTAQAATEAVAEPVKLTWYGCSLGTQVNEESSNTPVMKELTKRTGIVIDFSLNFNVNDTHERAAVMIASGDLPDIMSIDFAANGSKVLAAKVAIPLDELIKTNGKDILENCNYGIAVTKLSKTDSTGALYFIPNLMNGTDFPSNVMSNGWNIRWDLYKKLGCPKVETYDDFIKLIQDMLKLEPTNKDGLKNYGTGLWFPEWWCNLFVDKVFANMAGQIVGSDYFFQLDMKTDKVVPRLTDPDSTYYKGAAFYNQCYRLGLLDPDSITQKYQNWSEKAQAGRAMFHGANWALGGADKQFIADGTPEKGYVPLVFDINPDNIYAGVGYAAGATMSHYITTSCKNPEKAMDLLNYLATPDGALLISAGIEGQHWDAKDGKVVIKPEVIQSIKSDPDYLKNQGICNNAMAPYMAVLDTTNLIDEERNLDCRFQLESSYVQSIMTEVQKDYCRYYGYEFPTEPYTRVPVYIGNNFSVVNSLALEQGSDLQNKENKMKAYVDANYPKMIIQKTPEDYEKEKAKFIADLKAMGADDVVKYFSDAYEQIKSKLAEMTK